METHEAILDIVNLFGLTIEQALNFIAASLFVIAGLMIFNTLVQIFRGLINIIEILINKINEKIEARKNASK